MQARSSGHRVERRSYNYAARLIERGAHRGSPFLFGAFFVERSQRAFAATASRIDSSVFRAQITVRRGNRRFHSPFPFALSVRRFHPLFPFAVTIRSFHSLLLLS